MDGHKVRQDGALILEAAAKIVQGSITDGMIGDERSVMAAAVTAEFLRQHAEFVRAGCLEGRRFCMVVPAEVR